MSSRNSANRSAAAEFRRMLKWIALAAIVMTIGALWFAAATADLSLHMAVAIIAGVLVSVVLGSGLFALAFFSDKSGHDAVVTDASRQRKRSDDR